MDSCGNISLQLYRGVLIGIATSLARSHNYAEADKVEDLRNHLKTLTCVKFGTHNLFDESFTMLATHGSSAQVVLLGVLYEVAVGNVLAATARARKGRGSRGKVRDNSNSDPWAMMSKWPMITTVTGVELSATQKTRKRGREAGSVHACSQLDDKSPTATGRRLIDRNDDASQQLAVVTAELTHTERALASRRAINAASQCREGALWSAVRLLQPRTSMFDCFATEIFSRAQIASMPATGTILSLEAGYRTSSQEFGKDVYGHNNKFGHLVNLG